MADQFDPTDVLNRLAALEDFTSALPLESLPLGQLQSKLENDWQPDASMLLQPNSITADQLAAGAAVLTGQTASKAMTWGNGVWAHPGGWSNHVVNWAHKLGTVDACSYAVLSTTGASIISHHVLSVDGTGINIAVNSTIAQNVTLYVLALGNPA